MRDIFLADAHLGIPTDDNYRRLIDFLTGLQGEVRTLFLLGDIFEFWSNFRQAPQSYQPLVDVLESLAAQGCEIVWVEGNHDFHLERYFGRRERFRILPDGGSHELDGQTVYVAHGDLVDPANHSYLRLRRVLRSSLIALITGVVPISLLERIAARMSRASKKRRRSYDRQAELTPLLEKHAAKHIADGARAVITGHYHTPLCKQLSGGTMIALGDWIHDYSYAEHHNGTFTLKSLND